VGVFVVVECAASRLLSRAREKVSAAFLDHLRPILQSHTHRSHRLRALNSVPVSLEPLVVQLGVVRVITHARGFVLFRNLLSNARAVTRLAATNFHKANKNVANPASDGIAYGLRCVGTRGNKRGVRQR
jgi:hypothetical protein